MRKPPLKVFNSRIVGVSREKLDPSSTNLHTDFTSYYSMSGHEKAQRLGVFEVVKASAGYLRMGIYEEIPLKPGDLIAVSLDSINHWDLLDGETCAVLNWESVMGILHPTRLLMNSHPLTFECVRDYALLSEDPEAMRRAVLRDKGSSGLVLDGVALKDGIKGDTEKQNRFPILYSRLLSKGPGIRYPSVHDEGITFDVVRNTCDADIGSLVTYVSTFAAARFTWFGEPRALVNFRNLEMQVDES